MPLLLVAGSAAVGGLKCVSAAGRRFLQLLPLLLLPAGPALRLILLQEPAAAARCGAARAAAAVAPPLLMREARLWMPSRRCSCGAPAAPPPLTLLHMPVSTATSTTFLPLLLRLQLSEWALPLLLPPRVAVLLASAMSAEQLLLLKGLLLMER